MFLEVVNKECQQNGLIFLFHVKSCCNLARETTFFDSKTFTTEYSGTFMTKSENFFLKFFENFLEVF